VETVRPDYGTTIPIFFRTANDDAPATTPSPLVVQLQCRLLVKKREIAAFENDLDIHIESSGSARFCGFYEVLRDSFYRAPNAASLPDLVEPERRTNLVEPGRTL